MKIKQLPHPIRQWAIENLDEGKTDDVNVFDGFEWYGTKEGSEFWCEVYLSRSETPEILLQRVKNNFPFMPWDEEEIKIIKL